MTSDELNLDDIGSIDNLSDEEINALAELDDAFISDLYDGVTGSTDAFDVIQTEGAAGQIEHEDMLDDLDVDLGDLVDDSESTADENELDEMFADMAVADEEEAINKSLDSIGNMDSDELDTTVASMLNTAEQIVEEDAYDATMDDSNFIILTLYSRDRFVALMAVKKTVVTKFTEVLQEMYGQSFLTIELDKGETPEKYMNDRTLFNTLCKGKIGGLFDV